jgi:hypothetical protein
MTAIMKKVKRNGVFASELSGDCEYFSSVVKHLPFLASAASLKC